MDYTVGSHDVGLDHLRIVDHDAARRINRQIAALHGLGRGELHHVLSRHFPRNHVVGKDGGELVLISQQGLERARGKLRERLVGRGENRERTLAGQRFD